MKQGALDIHASLRIWTDKDPTGRIVPKHNAPSLVDLQRDLSREIRKTTERLAFLQSWQARFSALEEADAEIIGNSKACLATTP